MMTISDVHIENLTQQVADLLVDKKLVLVTAESCTGGWVAKCCTDRNGSSAWFDRGFVTYSNQAKQDLLGVSESTLDDFGAVSEQTAIEMAIGAIDFSQANISIAVTGIAGPTGGSQQKPVGTVWLAWAFKNGRITSVLHHFSGDRESIRRQAVSAALEGIIKNARDT